MVFESLADFLNMGGYGVYVWSVYAIGFLVLAANVLYPLMQRRQFYRQQQVRLRGEADRPAAS